jgi:hypothetical protein
MINSVVGMPKLKDESQQLSGKKMARPEGFELEPFCGRLSPQAKS